MDKPMLTIVVPCFNEEEVLKDTFSQLSAMLENLIVELLISEKSKLLFVDDGSKDSTWRLIDNESEINHFVTGVKLSRNTGHQNALLAGLETASTQSD